jgi:hypothetical protein
MISTLPGVPSWGAVLLAITFAALGFAFDAGSGGKELTTAFAGAYVIGCVLAVVAVRQSGVFTAVIQPPLVLFIAVPSAYFLFHGSSMDGIKDLLINCGYPLIERFPLMFFTSAIVLLIGLVRWYMGMSRRRGEPEEEAAETEGMFSAMTSKIAGLLAGDADGERDDAPAPRRSRQHSIDRAARPARAATDTARSRDGRPAKRAQPSRSRHNLPPETEVIEPVAERPRRPRTARRTTEPTVPPAEPRRRTRAASTREPRKQPPAADRRSPYQRPDRHSRFDGFEPYEPHGTNGTNGSNGSNGSGVLNGTHHPISRVRYRGADEGEERPQYRTRPRAAGRHEAEEWEYDV